MSILKKNVFLFLFFAPGFLSLDAKPVLWEAVRLFQPDLGSFSDPQGILIESGKIVSIQKSKSLANPKFIVPSFCDALSHFSVPYLRDYVLPEDWDRIRKNYLQFGFKSVGLMGEGKLARNEFSKFSATILSGPNIIFHDQILVEEDEEGKVPEPYLNLNQMDWSTLRMKPTGIYREMGRKEALSSREIWEIQKEIKTRKIPIFAIGDGDFNELKDFRQAEIQTYFGEVYIDLESNQKYEMEFKNWSPAMAQSYILNHDFSSNLNEFIQNSVLKYPGMEESYKPLLQKFLKKDEPTDPRKWENHKKYFHYFAMADGNMIFSTQSWIPNLPAGFAIPLELALWEQAGPDSEEFRTKILQALTKNSCGFLGESYKLELGNSADFIVYSQNPVSKLGGIMEMEAVVIKGSKFSWKNQNSNSKTSSKKASKKGEK
jgi:hypothetical protein